MKLHIPEQNAPAADAIPNHPRKLKKWLSDLPHANMGEMTKQIFNAVRDLNRQTMPNKHRLENLEQLREPLRNIFNNLEKYFINRTLPLPEKSQKIVHLNQSLLQEVSYGYKIIVYEAANAIDKKVDTKTQTIAILRAIRYLSELLLRASEVYEPYPAGTWYDIHQMYAYAESKGIQNKAMPDNEYEHKKATIEDFYKQVLLFSLARPIALRQSDSERVYSRLADWARLTRLGKDPHENQINRYFCASMDLDRPPSYLSERDCRGDADVRTLDASELVDSIRKQISEMSDTDSLAVGSTLSQETLQVLAMSWGICAKRRFSRADRRGHIKAAIGLANAASEIASEGQPIDLEKEAEEIMPGRRHDITLEAIPEDFDETRSELNTGYVTHHELGGDGGEDAWDMVAKGRVLTETYERTRQFLDDEKMGLNKDKDELQWEIVNVSAGGYCLRWDSDTTSKAQIGEIIALREKEASGDFAWRIGVIRWMQLTSENGLDFVVQLLSPKVMAASAQRANRPDEAPFDCLMLPGIKPLKQPPTVLLPAHAFRNNDRLRIAFMDQAMKIQLGSVKEHTGSFTQFQFSTSEEAERVEKAEKEKSAAKNKDNFDELWSSL